MFCVTTASSFRPHSFCSSLFFLAFTASSLQGRLLTHFGYGDQSVLAPAIGNNNDVSIGISYRYYDWVHVAVTFDGLSTEDHNVQ